MIPDCPPGLEPLLGLESVWVKQKVDLMETFLPVETKNSYQITDYKGTQIYVAFEKSNVFGRQLLGTSHPFRMEIIDNYGRMILYVERPWACCEDRVTIHLYDGTILGSIAHWCCSCNFHVYDLNRTEIFKIEGPPCGCNLCACKLTQDFDVFPVNSKVPIAQIRKEFAGVMQEMATDADTFGVEFPLNLDARMKAVLIGAVFLIDFTYYETAPQNNAAKGAGAGVGVGVGAGAGSQSRAGSAEVSAGIGESKGENVGETSSHSIF